MKLKNTTERNIGDVCSDCGIVANYITCWKKYGKPPIRPAHSVSTFHLGTCRFCNQKRQVTESRDFFYPDFGLLRKVLKYL